MLNKVILIGRLTRDVELNYTPQGNAVAQFTLAVQRKYNREEADFINIVVWRGLAENCANYLKKGRMAAVEGRLQVRSYKAQDGQKRWIIEVVAEDVRFLGDGKGSNTDNQIQDEDWNDIGKEISLEDIDIANSIDEMPF